VSGSFAIGRNRSKIVHYADCRLPWRPRPKLLRLAAPSPRSERRAKARYPMVAEVRFVIARGQLIANGLGHTVNMSSTGLLLESEHALPVGRKITLSVAWPALLNGEAGLTLRVRGRTIRMQGRYTAVQILGYDFRTRSRAARKEDEARSQVSTPRRQLLETGLGNTPCDSRHDLAEQSAVSK
jgi:hypothetical protein